MPEEAPRDEPTPEYLEKVERTFRKLEFIQRANKLIEQPEALPFSGLEEEAYATLKATDEECPGFVTPIDELIKRLESEGIKVVFGDDPESGNIFILPQNSDDVERDSVFPRHLKITEDMPFKLKDLILAHRRCFEFGKK